MIEIIFTFIITYLVLFVCWFLPKAGTPDFSDPTKKELLGIAFVALLPTIMVGVML